MGILDDAIREHLELKRQHGAAEEEVTRKEAEAFGPVRTDVAAEPPPAAEETALLQHGDATAAYEVEAELPQAPAEDPYAVHPGDEPVPDPHHEGEPGGKDPGWREDTDFFAEAPAAGAMAEAGAGVLPEGGHAEPGPPAAPETPVEPYESSPPEAPVAPQSHPDDHRRVFDTDEHLHGGSRPPDPVYGHQAEVPAPPAEPEPAPVDDPPVGDPPVEDPDIDEPPPRQAPEGGGEEDVLEETPEFLQDAPEHDRLWFEQKPPRDFDFGE
ncbi:MAG: hypothetical protein ACJ76Z_00345 [Thermoleophilaceae bacterium]